MTKHPSVLAFANHPWEGPWAGRQQILSRLAKRGWPVLYSTGPLTLWDRGSDEWNRAGLGGSLDTSDGVLLDKPGRLRASWPRFRAWHRLVLRSHGARLRRMMTRREGPPGILFIFHPAFYPFAEAERHARIVYHAYDTFAMLPGWLPEYGDYEAALVDRADLVLATSPAIKRNLPGRGPDTAVEFNNGVDFDLFSAGAQAPVPDDLKRIGGPRIGFVGRITPKVDFALVADLARTRPDWNWVFVGPVVVPSDGREEMEKIAHAGLMRCRECANIHFLGTKHHTELPAYMGNMDVNVISNRVGGGWWQAAYPLKMHEYLATGRPVVGSELEVFEDFSDVIDVARTAEEWLSAIEDALKNGGRGTPDRRVAVARENSWDARVDVLERLLEETLADND